MLVVIILIFLLIAAMVALLSYKRQLRALTGQMAQLDAQRSNGRLSISSGDAALVRLAVEVNKLYDEMDAQRAAHIAAMDDIRQSMANISHDLRTPLTSILGYLKLLKSGTAGAEQQSRYLSIAFDKADALNRLINQLFELTNLQAGNYPLELERLDANELLSEAVAALYEPLTACHAQPNIILSQTPLYIIADRQAVTRIFDNLLENIIKYSTGRVEIESKAENGAALFRFSNQTQLVLDDAQQLFQRSFTANHARNSESTGLGLSIVQEFCQLTNGALGCSLHEQQLVISIRWNLMTGS